MKSKFLIPFIAAFLLAISLSSCEKKIHGEGPIVSQTRTVGNYTKVFLTVPALLYVTQDPAYSFTIEAQQNILDIIQTSVSGGELRIKFDNGKNISNHDRIIIRLSAPLFESLSISGSGSILLPEISVAGDIDAVISGSGNIQVTTGMADDATLTISGSGSMEMLGVSFKTLNAHISGSGNVKGTVSQQIDAHISGSGSVYYKGTPAVSSQVSGSGSVKKVQ